MCANGTCDSNVAIGGDGADVQLLKPSRYNIIVQRTADTPPLLFNTRTLRLFALEDEEENSICSILGRDRIVLGNGPPEEEAIGILTEHGFLVALRKDELSELQYRSRANRFSEIVGLTILPTLRCNFDCRYCFSRSVDADMSHEVQDAILSNLEDLPQRKSLRVSWFGGEPLLRRDVIVRLSRRFRNLFDDYGATIITNGYLLDGDTAKTLAEENVYTAQVTIDGPRKYHDVRRPLVGGSPTYDKIMQNLEASAPYIRIGVRINTDAEMASSPEELADFVGELAERTQGKAQAYFSPIIGIADRAKTIRRADLSWEDYSAAIERTYQILLRRHTKDIQFPWLNHSPGVCGGNCEQYSVVAPSGDLYRCWEEPSGLNEQTTGSVLRSGITDSEQAQLVDYLMWDETLSPECVECKHLPVCMGGCARMSLSGAHRGKYLESCEKWRHWLPAVLRLRYRLRKQSGELVSTEGEDESSKLNVHSSADCAGQEVSDEACRGAAGTGS